MTTIVVALVAAISGAVTGVIIALRLARRGHAFGDIYDEERQSRPPPRLARRWGDLNETPRPDLDEVDDAG